MTDEIGSLHAFRGRERGLSPSIVEERLQRWSRRNRRLGTT